MDDKQMYRRGVCQPDEIILHEFGILVHPRLHARVLRIVARLTAAGNVVLAAAVGLVVLLMVRLLVLLLVVVVLLLLWRV